MAGKKKETRVIITGFGGQGIVLTGSILGKAATIHDGRRATMTQSYGPEARGGSCSAQVIISDGEIAFPYVEEAHLLVCMSQEGYEKNLPALLPGGTLVWDTDLVKTGQHDPSWKTFDVPATRYAEELGNKMMANIVMLGFISAAHPPANPEAMLQAMLGAVPPRTKENNQKAFDRGRRHGQDSLARPGKPASRERP
jgi:2-oxoglutarate ferredoxin oxidoreductase subunit gamma